MKGTLEYGMLKEEKQILCISELPNRKAAQDV
jgi:hypothetical protein